MDLLSGLNPEQREAVLKTEGPLLIRAQELITPGDRRIHRLLALGEITWADGRKQDVALESAERVVHEIEGAPRSADATRRV